MSEIGVEELQRIAREDFGRDLSAEQAEQYRGRLVVMSQAILVIREWERRMGDDGPAAVHRAESEPVSAYASL